jgi:hypothetical protein
MADKKKQDKFSGGQNNSNNRAKDPDPEGKGKRFIDDPKVSPERKREIIASVTATDGPGSDAWARKHKLPPYDKD